MKILHAGTLATLALMLISCEKDPGERIAPAEELTVGADILISEILPDPFKDGAEFVELYNRSDKVIDLSQYAVASTNSRGITGTPRSISKSTRYIYPGAYTLLSKDAQAVISQYPVPPVIEAVLIENFPQLTNTEGAVVLMRGEEVVDSLHYTAKMHDELIRNPKGVSLERVSFRVGTNSAGNFISASATSGYATPGYINAQRENHPTDGPAVRLNKRTLQRGKGETLAVQFNLPVGGRMTSIAVFTSTGEKVRQLVQNHRLGTLDEISWDGMAAGGKKPAAGVYYIHVELYDSSGYLQNFKEICFLSD
jgi:hypothetical protein